MRSQAIQPLRTAPSVHFEPTEANVEAYIVTEAKQYGVNPVLATWIVGHESQFDYRYGHYDPAEVGDDGNSIGTWQISIIYHPEVPVSCSASLTCSTEWAMQQIKAGKATAWTTFKYCRKWWPETCPF